MADIFLSYASQDRDRVRPIVEFLESHGYGVWWDRQIGLGASFDLEIERELDKASCAIVVWTEHSVASDWVRNEAGEAYERGILVPIQLDNIKPPLAYRRVQMANLVSWDGDAHSNQLDSLFAIVEHMVGAKARTEDRKQPPAETELRDDRAAMPSIAVLPISNLSSEKDFEYLADGMTDEVITLLSADPNLAVVERHSTYSYRGENQDARHIADELDVRYIVEGGLRAAGNRIRMTVHLVDAESNRQLWAKRFNEPLEMIFDVQDEIVDGIVAAVEGEVYRAESERSRRRDPESLNAWGLVVRAKSELGRLGSSGFEQVISLCRRAIEMNPDTALAYALLANALAMRSSVLSTDPDRSEAMQLVERAMSAANDDPLVLTYSANALGWLGEGSRALSIIQRSLDLAPNISTSVGTLAWAHLVCGNFSHAIDFATKAISMSPRDLSLGRWYTTKAVAHSNLEQWEECIEAITTAIERMPQFANAWATKANALLNTGQYEESVAAAKTATELAPESWMTVWIMAQALACAGQNDSAIDAAERAVDLGGETQWRPLVTLANILGQAGLFTEAQAVWDRAATINPELSLEYLEKVEGVGTMRLGYMSTEGLRAAGIR
jgi:TolB-like protein/Flp pilus assembly protein TadD